MISSRRRAAVGFRVARRCATAFSCASARSTAPAALRASAVGCGARAAAISAASARPARLRAALLEQAGELGVRLGADLRGLVGGGRRAPASRMCDAAASAATSSSCAVSRACRRVAIALRRSRLIAFFGLPPLPRFLAPDSALASCTKGTEPTASCAQTRGCLRSGCGFDRRMLPRHPVKRGRGRLGEGPADGPRLPRAGRARLRRPHRSWSTSPTSRPRRGRELTGARMAELARAQAGGLERLGVGQGERVAIVTQNSARLLTAFFGVSAYGRVLVPINFRLNADEVRLHRRALRRVGAARRPRARRRARRRHRQAPLRDRRGDRRRAATASASSRSRGTPTRTRPPPSTTRAARPRARRACSSRTATCGSTRRRSAGTSASTTATCTCTRCRCSTATAGA